MGLNMRILEYAQGLNANSEVLWWISTVAKSALAKNKTDESQLEHIIDWFLSGSAPKRLQKMSIEVAKKKTDEWMQRNITKGRAVKEEIGDLETFIDFGDGFKFVKLLTKNAYQKEGSLMSHCLGGYKPNKDFSIYSLRDAKGHPHCTIECRGEKELNQIKGKGNGAIHPKYINYVLAFLEKVGVKVRSSEMRNLGFYHVDSRHLDFIKRIGRESELVQIKGEYYAH